MMDSMAALWPYFVATLLIEGAVLALFRYRGLNKETPGTDIAVFIGANLLSWPLLHYIWFRWALPLPLLELGVALLEAAVWRTSTTRTTRQSLLLSFISNAISYLIGICVALL
jgi:hypothetical protein